MTKAQAIYTAETLIQVEHIRALLDNEGIRTTVRNQYLSAGLGELPAFECWPELWLVNEGDSARAQRFIQDYLRADPGLLQDWRCPQCGETIEGQFSQCWHCGAEHPGQTG